MTPTTASQLALFIAAVLPGFVFQGVRARICGDAKENADLTTRLTRALAISVMLDCLYLLVFGTSIVTPFRATSSSSSSFNARLLALETLGLIFAIPAFLALTYSYRGSGARWWSGHIKSDGPRRAALRMRLQKSASRNRLVRRGSRETTWDDAINKVTEKEGFMRIRKPDGSWVGGRFYKDSAFSEYPDEPSVFLDEGWILSDVGEFKEPQRGSRGTWITCNDAVVVDFVGLEDEDVGKPSTGPEQPRRGS